MIVDSSRIDRDLRLRADCCVIGSGAGGSVVTRELAAAGLSVVLLEEGGYYTSADFTQHEEEMYARLYRERGTRPTTDHRVIVSQGRALGGSTVVSYCLCFRPRRAVLDAWRTRSGCDVSEEDLRPHLDRIEERIGVRQAVEDDLNPNNRILRDGSRALGFRGDYVRHNRTDCLGCGSCALGCPFDRKGDALTTDLADASRRGARLLPDVRVEQILHRRGRVQGVEARCLRGRGALVRVEAATVVLAAGALESPCLWIRSKLPNPHGFVGRNLRLNFSAAVVGVFEEPVRSWSGMPHSWMVDEFIDVRPEGGGFLILSGGAQPVATAALLPGAGAAHRRLMEQYPRLAVVSFVLNERGTGETTIGRRGQVEVDCPLGEADRVDVRRALRASAEILFAAGARSVVFPFNEVVEISSPDEASLVEGRALLANDPLFLSFQPQGTLRMGGRAKDSVCDAFGKAHGIDGLWVSDASLIPAPLAAPPQLTIMALASRAAARIASQGRT